MFRSARIKLTVWYLGIITLISVSFSVVIYRMLTAEVDRFERAQRIRIETNPFFFPGPAAIDPEVFEEARHRIFLNIVMANGTILILAGGLGYMLAGKTLSPIQNMVDEQNRFISDASHELRTPLTALKSSMEVFLRDKRAKLADARELASGGLEEVNQMQQLSDAMLRLTRYQDQTRQTKLQRFPIKAVIGEAVKKIEPMAKLKSININSHIEDYEIVGFKNDVTEMMTILMDNAIKYSPENSEITVITERSGNLSKILIIDHGIGISREDLPHVFERFYRADSARSRTDAGGYGLGLAIAKKIAENHHAAISVQSEEGHGSTFTVIFQENWIKSI